MPWKYSVPRVGTAALLTCERYPHQVLIGKRKGSHGSGCWALPGGFLELGESFEDGALRELNEETGLSCAKSLSIAGVTNNVMIEDDVHSITIFVLCCVYVDDLDDIPTPIIMEPEKCEEWKWISWNKLRDYCHDDDVESHATIFNPLKQLVTSGYSPFEIK